ncbi:MAG: hypothetical protein JST62_13210 [Bacteroidetes bacterium]|nr:hypothetical protein [Bacteroidota bacterium]
MFDRFPDQVSYIDFDEYFIMPKSFEIWNGGKMQERGKTNSSFGVKKVKVKNPEMDNIEVRLSSDLRSLTLPNFASFDMAIRTSDRYLMAVLPLNSNVEFNLAYKAFLGNFPFRTRNRKTFSKYEPNTCSLFFIKGVPSKITFGLPMAEILVEFSI